MGEEKALNALVISSENTVTEYSVFLLPLIDKTVGCVPLVDKRRRKRVFSGCVFRWREAGILNEMRYSGSMNLLREMFDRNMKEG